MYMYSTSDMYMYVHLHVQVQYIMISRYMYMYMYIKLKVKRDMINNYFDFSRQFITAVSKLHIHVVDYRGVPHSLFLPFLNSQS